MFEGVEELLDIDLQDPATAHGHDLVAQQIQRTVRRPARPEAMRAGQEVLFVDGLQQHRDCALQHLVFESRDSERAYFAIALWYPDPADGRCAVTARLHPVE